MTSAPLHVEADESPDSRYAVEIRRGMLQCALPLEHLAFEQKGPVCLLGFRYRKPCRVGLASQHSINGRPLKATWIQALLNALSPFLKPLPLIVPLMGGHEGHILSTPVTPPNKRKNPETR